MNLKFHLLNSMNTLLPAEPEARANVLAYGIGLALASLMPIPSAPQEDRDTYFNLQVRPLINAPLSEINECVVVKTREVIEYAKVFWSLRYLAVHYGPQLAYAEESPYGFFDTLLGANLYVSPAMHECVNAHKDAVWKVYRATLSGLKDLNAVEA